MSESGSPPAWLAPVSWVHVRATRERGCRGRTWDAGPPPRAFFVPAPSCGRWLHCLPLCPALPSSVRANKVSVPARNVSVGPASLAHSFDPCSTLEKAVYPFLRTQNLHQSSIPASRPREPRLWDQCVCVGAVGGCGGGGVELRSDCHKPRRAYEVISILKSTDLIC